MNELKYVRDSHSKAVLNTDYNELQVYKMMKKKKEQEMSDINNMKKDIEELKQMITKLLGNQNG